MKNTKLQKKVPHKTNRYFIRNRIHELNGKFREATRKMGSNIAGTQLNEWQTDFAHYIHEASRGPEYIAPKFLLNAEALISQINETRSTT